MEKTDEKTSMTRVMPKHSNRMPYIVGQAIWSSMTGWHVVTRVERPVIAYDLDDEINGTTQVYYARPATPEEAAIFQRAKDGRVAQHTLSVLLGTECGDDRDLEKKRAEIAALNELIAQETNR